MYVCMYRTSQLKEVNDAIYIIHIAYVYSHIYGIYVCSYAYMYVAMIEGGQ